MGNGTTRTQGACVETAGAIDMDAVDREIEELKKTLKLSRIKKTEWTDADDRKLLALWPDYNKVAVSRAMKRNEASCRARYLELTGKK